MLAMHYKIALRDQAAVAAVRARAAERGPLFDGMKGLAHKLFLVDPKDPCYATFYLWRDPDAALGFLNGPFFAALSSTFGRPEVCLLLTEAAELPRHSAQVALSERKASCSVPPGAIAALDPRSGEALTLSPDPSVGRRFEVMYHARGGGLS
jgi:hypothetical protein